MAHFYGTLQGQAGSASRLGSKNSGITSTVETWGCELRASIDHYDRFPDEAMDMLSVRFGDKGNSKHLFILRNPDAVAANMDDMRMRLLFDRVDKLFKQIEDELPKAIKRKERAEKQRQRVEGRRLREQAKIRQQLTGEEFDRLTELARLEGYTTEAYELSVTEPVECPDTGAAGGTARPRDVFTRPKFSQHLTHIVSLTTGSGLDEIRERFGNVGTVAL